MKNIKTKLKNNENSYDAFPYDSYPFPYTRPDYIKTVGMLFGMQPPPLETARILELGCASGGNIVNFAETYPKSYTLGVDLSKVQIAQGVKLINELGLENIELKHLSITEIDESYGKFDYIICHGVFSWVPEFVREKILEISKKLLILNGISFISYNTLPGWNMVNTIRDMMKFHSAIFEETVSKLQQAKLFLKFINESLEGHAYPYSNFLKEETQALMQRDDSYIMHEYLEDENKQFYFQEFVKMANANGLTYLGEANVHTMFLGNMPEKAVEKLQSVNDIVRTEQYMDFIQNRRFRCTLLCHNNISLNRNIGANDLKDFYVTCNLETKKLAKEVNLKDPLESIKFNMITSKDICINTSSPVMKAIFYTFIENIGNLLKIDELLNLVHKKLPDLKLQDLKQEFANVSGKLVFTGYMKLFAQKPNSIFKISVKPKVSNLVRLQIKNLIASKPWITTQINEVFVLQPYERYILELLDGKNTIEQITKGVYEKFVSKEIIANEGDRKITDKTVLESLAKQCVEIALERFKTNYILIG